MAETIQVWYVDAAGHLTGSETWSATMLPFDAFVHQGAGLDWSDPDHGIRAWRMGGSYEEGHEGEVLELVPRDDAMVVFGREDMERAGSVVVDGVTVLVRAAEGEKPDFACGLRWADGNGGDTSEDLPSDDAPPAAPAGASDAGGPAPGEDDAPGAGEPDGSEAPA
ncbi:MAG: hypothetical protein J6D54_00805, partial [Olsenella sp.]|nr:hypothetical protein [Olsenella sp.]